MPGTKTTGDRTFQELQPNSPASSPAVSGSTGLLAQILTANCFSRRVDHDDVDVGLQYSTFVLVVQCAGAVFREKNFSCGVGLLIEVLLPWLLS